MHCIVTVKMKTVGNYIQEVSERGDSIAFLAYKYTMRAMFQADRVVCSKLGGR